MNVKGPESIMATSHMTVVVQEQLLNSIQNAYNLEKVKD